MRGGGTGGRWQRAVTGLLDGSRMPLMFIPGTKSFEPEKYSNKQTEGAAQHVDPDAEVVEPELIGHRWHGSMFMSAQ